MQIQYLSHSFSPSQPANNLIIIIFRREVLGKDWRKTICLQLRQWKSMKFIKYLTAWFLRISVKISRWNRKRNVSFSTERIVYPNLVTNFSVNFPIWSREDLTELIFLTDQHINHFFHCVYLFALSPKLNAWNMYVCIYVSINTPHLSVIVPRWFTIHLLREIKG